MFPTSKGKEGVNKRKEARGEGRKGAGDLAPVLKGDRRPHCMTYFGQVLSEANRLMNTKTETVILCSQRTVRIVATVSIGQRRFYLSSCSFALTVPPVALRCCSLELTSIWHSSLFLYAHLPSSSWYSWLPADLSDSPKCLTLCTLKIHLLTCLY